MKEKRSHDELVIARKQRRMNQPSQTVQTDASDAADTATPATDADLEVMFCNVLRVLINYRLPSVNN